MSRSRARSPRGFTLVEMTVVITLAALLTAALAGFYLSSQSAWTEGSTQALIQRDGTFLLAVISDSTRSAAQAQAGAYPDPEHEILYLRRTPGSDVSCCFYWRDSLLYMGREQPDVAQDQPLAPSHVSRFAVSTNGTSLVTVDLLELSCPGASPLRLGTAAALYNR